MTAPVLLDIHEGVATVTLNSPSTRNALSVELVDALLAALRTAASEDEARCVVLASAHERVWCAGGDLAAFTAEVPLIHKHFASERFPHLIEVLLGMEKPTICAANGHVLAGGLGVALCCDLIVASDRATFGTPEISVGAFPFMVTALLFRNVPRKIANEMLLLGQAMSAADARAFGLVNCVAEPDAFEATVTEVARKLAAHSPLLNRLGKQAMRRQIDMSLDDAIAYLRAQLTLAQSTADLHEGVTAFFEKRAPAWRGQ